MKLTRAEAIDLTMAEIRKHIDLGDFESALITPTRIAINGIGPRTLRYTDGRPPETYRTDEILDLAIFD